MPAAVWEELTRKFGTAITREQEEPITIVVVEAGALQGFASFLKEELNFDFMLFVTAVDYQTHLEVVYGVRSTAKNQDLLFKTRVSAEAPRVPSLAGLYPAADWDEREVFDLFGVEFAGHPNLTRILLPDDWEGHPLRKSYPLTKRPQKPY